MNTFSPKNDPSSMKLLWIEPEALRLCLNKPNIKLEEIIVLEEFGKSIISDCTCIHRNCLQHALWLNVSTEIYYVFHVEKDEIPVTAYPAVRRQQHLNEEHVSPVTHAVYAITW
jgi:hypothetical protein